jgi:hypothetical protein
MPRASLDCSVPGDDNKSKAFVYSVTTSAAFLTLIQLITRTDIRNDSFLFVALCCLAASLPMLTITTLAYVWKIETSPGMHLIIKAVGAYLGAALFAVALLCIFFSFGKTPGWLFFFSYLLANYIFRFLFIRRPK